MIPIVYMFSHGRRPFALLIVPIVSIWNDHTIIKWHTPRRTREREWQAWLDRRPVSWAIYTGSCVVFAALFYALTLRMEGYAFPSRELGMGVAAVLVMVLIMEIYAAWLASAGERMSITHRMVRKGDGGGLWTRARGSWVVTSSDSRERWIIVHFNIDHNISLPLPEGKAGDEIIEEVRKRAPRMAPPEYKENVDLSDRWIAVAGTISAIGGTIAMCLVTRREMGVVGWSVFAFAGLLIFTPSFYVMFSPKLGKPHWRRKTIMAGFAGGIAGMLLGTLILIVASTLSAG